MFLPLVPSTRDRYETVVFVRARRGKRRWTRRLTLVAGVSSLILGVILWKALPPSALDSAGGRLLDLKDKASVVRLFFVAVLFITWPLIIRLTSRTFEPSARLLQHKRVRVCGWLLVIELLVGQNLLGRALG